MTGTPAPQDVMQAVPIAAEDQATAAHLRGCKTASFSPEVTDFYGSAATILQKIDDYDLDIGDRRIYFLLVESATGAEIRFFERVSEELAAVYSWSGESAGDLKARIAEAILANRGINCIGEQVKALVADSFEVRLEGTVPAPVSPRAAFAHTIRNNDKDGFIRATTGLLC